jgi:hypothetical protein
MLKYSIVKYLHYSNIIREKYHEIFIAYRRSIFQSSAGMQKKKKSK